MAKGRQGEEGQAHRFGGDWTTTKLEILRQYLVGYTTALKNQPFRTAYIDAFAGTGYRTLGRTEASGSLLFPDLAHEEPQGLLDGSARLALKVEPRFDKYIFIEQDLSRCEQLRGLATEFPHLAKDIKVEQGDANKVIQSLCSKKNWKERRAVLFLDPYGMAVEWSTIEKVAETRAIDLWLLFPLGIGVNRLLPRSGEIPDSWRKRLTLFLGTPEWEEVFYRQEKTLNLFGDVELSVVKASMEEIGGFFLNRLRSVFPGVAPKPKVLFNSTSCPLYLFCFAVGNPRAKDVALRIANHILKSD